MAKPNLLSGIQPTGKLHIGNYLGALKNWVALQNSGKYNCLFVIVDLHSLTENFSPKEKPKQILELAADFIAAGIDPKRSIIFQQSEVSAHAELTWILSTSTPMGELERMTQFKDKASRQKENINAGLFLYPVLQVCDVLLYSPKVVPVGEDQLQHLELTRTLARKFNGNFGDTFIEPQAMLTETPRVMSLQDPTKKMSKSVPQGCLFLDDTPDAIMDKVKRAVTDSGSEIFYDPESKPAISNLLRIYSAITGEKMEAIQERYIGRGYGDFKRELAGAIAAHFADYRRRKAELMKKPAILKKALKEGSARADKIASKKLQEIKKKIGILL